MRSKFEGPALGGPRKTEFDLSLLLKQGLLVGWLVGLLVGCCLGGGI